MLVRGSSGGTCVYAWELRLGTWWCGVAQVVHVFVWGSSGWACDGARELRLGMYLCGGAQIGHVVVPGSSGWAYGGAGGCQVGRVVVQGSSGCTCIYVWELGLGTCLYMGILMQNLAEQVS